MATRVSPALDAKWNGPTAAFITQRFKVSLLLFPVVMLVELPLITKYSGGYGLQLEILWHHFRRSVKIETACLLFCVQFFARSY